MNSLIIVDPFSEPSWDLFVKNHPFGWVSHLTGWNRILKRSFPHLKGVFLALKNDGRIDAALPFYEVKSRLTGKRLVSIPFASLSDPLVKDESQMQTLVSEAIKYSRDIGAKYIEIRTRGAYPHMRDQRLAVSHQYKHHYMLLDPDPETIKKSFDRSCVRQRISRAFKSNVTIRPAKDEQDLIHFYRLYLTTRKRLHLPPQPYSFIRSLWDTFSSGKIVSIRLAEFQGRIIAGLLLLKFRDRVSVEFMVSDKTFREVSPNHLLVWEAIREACTEGYKIFDFGKTTESNLSLMNFKRHWGTQVAELPTYVYPEGCLKKYGNGEGSKRYRVVKSICKTLPETMFTRFGNFCYRHMA
jgi:lipid II:glycine glycyltransferase (peptidoglycan interpeptide bridge formation enzyme)